MTEPERKGDCAEVLGGNRRIDRGLLLPDLDLWIHSSPEGGAEEGGDLVFVSVCSRDALSKVYLCDVTGHGPSVAPAARTFEHLIREHHGDPDLTAIFRSLNEEAGAIEGRTATMVGATYDRRESRLLYVYAAHPHLLYRSATDASFSAREPAHCPVPGEATGVPIGMIPGTAYFQSAVPFDPGDLAVLYSDALTDARLPDGGRVGLEGLLAAADRCRTDTSQNFRTDLDREFEETLGVREYGDDVTLVVIRRL